MSPLSEELTSLYPDVDGFLFIRALQFHLGPGDDPMVFRRHLQLPRLASVQRDEQRPNGRLGRHRRHNRRRFRRRGRVPGPMPVPVPVLLPLPQEGPWASPPTKAHNRGPRAPARCRDENESDDSGESDERLSRKG